MAVDLSQLSTEDLMRMRAPATAAAPAVDLSEIPTEQLMRMRPDAIDQGALEAMKPTRLERFGRGFADVAQGVKQIALKGAQIRGMVPPGTEDAYTAEKSDELARYERGRGPDAGVDWARLAGNVLATAPAAAIPGGAAPALVARMGVGATQGALASSTMFTPEGESRLKNMLLGAAFGGAVPAVLQGAKQAIIGLTRSMTQPSAETLAGIATNLAQELKANGVDWSKLPAAAQQSLLADAKAAVSAGADLQGDALARKATIEAVGAKPTRASVTRAPRDWQTEKNLRGIKDVGEPIVAREQENAAALQNYLETLGGPRSGETAYQVGDKVGYAVEARHAATGRDVSALYGKVREAAPDAAIFPSKLSATLDTLGDIADADSVVQSVGRRLKRLGADDPSTAQALDISKAEELRKFIGGLDTSTPTKKMAVTKLVGALDDDVMEHAGGDAFASARAAAKARFDEFGARPVKALIEGKIAPEDVVDRLFLAGKVDDVRDLTKTLRQSPGGQGALQSVKGAVLDHLLLKATGATSIDQIPGQFSGARFSKALEAIEPEKLHQLFSPAEIEGLRRLQSASRYLTEEVPFSDVNHSKTGAAIANLILKIGSTPVLGQITGMVAAPVKMGVDWAKNAAQRREVADFLLGKTQGATRPVPVYGAERYAPAVGADLADRAGNKNQ
jgi:hypothetical protein